jgi:uncharacterized phage-associated protein
MKISSRKLKAIILYFCENTNPIFLGKVKLMKLFYFLDFLHVKNYGTPVTYDCYVNLEHGPIPSSIKNLVDSVDGDVDNSILADVITIKNSEDLNIHRIFALRKFAENDKKYLSENELEILKRVCLRFGNSNTKDIEDASHREAPWSSTKIFDTIPYHLAAKDGDCLVDEETIKLLTEVSL